MSELERREIARFAICAAASGSTRERADREAIRGTRVAAYAVRLLPRWHTTRQ